MRLTVEALESEPGSVIVLSGRDDLGRLFTFGCDWRPAQAIVAALEAGEEVTAEVETWSLLGYSPAVQTVEERLAAAQADREEMTT